MFMQHHNDTIHRQTHDDKDAVINDAHRKTQEDFFIKYFTSHFICMVSKRVTQSLRVRGCWWPNITEIFWPRSYGRQRCVFLVLHDCSTGALAFLTTPRPTPSPTILLVLNPTRLSSTGSLNSTDRNSTDRNSTVLCLIRRPYITFKLPRGDMDTPPQLLPISSDLDVSLPLSLEWPVWSSSSGNNCHPVQKSLSSGASVYESIMGFFFTTSHFISQFPPTRFPLITAIRMCHFLPVHYLEWHFWPGQQVKT